MARINQIESQEQLDHLIQNHKKVLVDFKADWCGPCKMFHPILEEYAGKETGITIGQVDVDAHPDVANRYEVMSIPTLKLFHGGKLIKEASGFMTMSQLEAWVE